MIEDSPEYPPIVFETPPQLTDADIREALGDNLTDVMRLVRQRGIEALAWYVSFHQRASRYGIFIPLKGVLAPASMAFTRLTLPLERKLEISFHALLRHELFHFEADCMAANWELTLGTEVYWWAKVNCLGDFEEALGNAYMLRGFRHPGGVLRNARGSYDALTAFCAHRDGPHFARSRQRYIDGCRRFSADVEIARQTRNTNGRFPTHSTH